MMTKGLLRWLLTAGVAALLLPAHAAELGITPVSLQLDRLRDRGTVHVINQGREPVTLQADLVSWQRTAGEDVDGATDDVMINPPLFTLQPGQTQIVRVGLRRHATPDAESRYRIVMREVPPAPSIDRPLVNAQVRVLVTLRLPIYVAPIRVQRDERWTVQHDASGAVFVQATNAGNVHMPLGAIRLHEGVVGAALQPLAEQRVAGVLLPGESRRFRLEPAQRVASAAAPLTLEVLNERGAQHVVVAAAAP